MLLKLIALTTMKLITLMINPVVNPDNNSDDAPDDDDTPAAAAATTTAGSDDRLRSPRCTATVW